MASTCRRSKNIFEVKLWVICSDMCSIGNDKKKKIKARLLALRAGTCVWSHAPHPLGMVDILDKGRPSLLKRRGPDNPVRRLKRAKKHSPQGARNKTEDAPKFDPRELAHDTADKIVADIRLALTKTAREWMCRLPKLFWVAVSRPHMLAQVYWQCARSGIGGHATPSPVGVVRRLARWLQPLLPEVPPGGIYEFLVHTGLQVLASAYLGILRRVEQLGLYLSNDFGTEQLFAPSLHAEVNEGLLRAGDGCLVVFPGTLVLDRAPEERYRVVLERFVLSVQAPESLASLRQELQR